jgi:hypothetical protein
MFRKIVSNLPFSPALVGQLGFYVKRLRKEEATRRLGLIFVALALIVQSLAVFQPSESANASSETDMIDGGVSSLDGILRAYDTNTKHFQETLNYVGITRGEIANSKYGTWLPGNKLSWGYAPRFSYNQGERAYNIPDAYGQIATTVYARPVMLWGYSSNFQIAGWWNESQGFGGWFGIMSSCGNLMTDLYAPQRCTYNPALTVHDPNCKPKPKPKMCALDQNILASDPKCKPCKYNPNIIASDPKCKPKMCALNPKILASDPECLPCPGDKSIWINDHKCIPNIIKTKTATNTSQGFIDATKVNAHVNDQISYTISIKNTGLSPKSVELKESLGDVLQYANIIDEGGGKFNKTTNVLQWSNVTLDPKQTQTRTFVVQLLSAIPATATGLSDPTSYDCYMTNVFGNSISIKVDCPTAKVVEQVVQELPKTGPTENMIFSGVILSIATYFYARARQTKKEVYAIRKEVSIGTF